MTQPTPIKKDWAPIIWLILFFPVGLFKMWRSHQFPFIFKLITTSIFVIIMVAMRNQDTPMAPPLKQEISGKPTVLREEPRAARTLASDDDTSEQELKERQMDAKGEQIRKKYTNGIFKSSMVNQNKNELTYKLWVNESQWKAMDQKQKHQLVTFVLNDIRNEFCKDSAVLCRVELEGMHRRQLAKSTNEYKIILLRE